jgi:hypothetical protein
MPPILTEIQYLVDQDLMLRLIRDASSTYDRYRVLPLVLVLVTKGFSSTAFRREFTVSSKGVPTGSKLLILGQTMSAVVCRLLRQ